MKRAEKMLAMQSEGTQFKFAQTGDKVFEMFGNMEEGMAVAEKGFGKVMNVEQFNNSSITFFTFTPFGKKVQQRIKLTELEITLDLSPKQEEEPAAEVSEDVAEIVEEALAEEPSEVELDAIEKELEAEAK